MAPLLAGHGTSIADLARTGRRDWVASAATAIRRWRGHHDALHLVGFSMGGLVALVVAEALAPATITLVNTPARLRDRRAPLLPLVHQWLAPVRHAGPPADLVDDAVAAYLLAYPGYPVRAAAEVVRLMRGARRSARRVRARSLVVQSRADATVDPRSGPMLAGRLPDSRLVWLEQAGHQALLHHERHVVHGEVLALLGSGRA